MAKIKEKCCIVCNKYFTTIYERVTCSNKCQYKIVSEKVSKSKGGKITRHCKFCGKEFICVKSSPKTLCSSKCRTLWRRSAYKGKGNPAWKPLDLKKPFRRLSTKLRREILNDKDKCELCGSREFLELHHIDRNETNNSLDNFIVLCYKCHANQHIGEKAYHLILLRRNHKELPIIQCQTCKKDIIPYFKGQRFCSRKCAAIHNFPHGVINPKRKTVKKEEFGSV